jgi:excisionase family DNA binding protein
MRKQYLNVTQAAAYLTLSKSTVYQYLHYKKIPFFKIGERVIFSKSELDKWIKRYAKKVVKKNLAIT